MLIPLNYAQANIIYNHGIGTPTGAEVTIGLNTAGFSGSTTDIGQAVYDSLVTSNIFGNLSDDVAIEGVLVKEGPNATGPSALYSNIAQGAVSGDSTPPNTAILVHKVTAFGGRQGRGRMFWPGLPEAGMLGSGNLAGTYQADLQTGFTSFYDELVAADLIPTLLHGDTPSPPGPYGILAFNVDARVATQRRRLRR